MEIDLPLNKQAVIFAIMGDYKPDTLTQRIAYG